MVGKSHGRFVGNDSIIMVTSPLWLWLSSPCGFMDSNVTVPCFYLIFCFFLRKPIVKKSTESCFVLDVKAQSQDTNHLVKYAVLLLIEF